VRATPECGGRAKADNIVQRVTGGVTHGIRAGSRIDVAQRGRCFLRWGGCEGFGCVARPTSVVRENEALLIRVWIPSPVGRVLCQGSLDPGQGKSVRATPECGVRAKADNIVERGSGGVTNGIRASPRIDVKQRGRCFLRWGECEGFGLAFVPHRL
jgi:hypothetical protein